MDGWVQMKIGDGMVRRHHGWELGAMDMTQTSKELKSSSLATSRTE